MCWSTGRPKDIAESFAEVDVDFQSRHLDTSLETPAVTVALINQGDCHRRCRRSCTTLVVPQVWQEPRYSLEVHAGKRQTRIMVSRMPSWRPQAYLLSIRCCCCCCCYLHRILACYRRPSQTISDARHNDHSAHMLTLEPLTDVPILDHIPHRPNNPNWPHYRFKPERQPSR